LHPRHFYILFLEFLDFSFEKRSFIIYTECAVLEESLLKERMVKKLSIIVLSSFATTVAMGDIYVDPVGDIATGNANLDITQVEVTDNGTDLVVRLTVDNLDSDWGNYMFFMDAWDGGSPDNDNPWGRNISGTEGMDIFAGSWIDNGGGVDAQEYGVGGWGALPFVASVWVDWDNNTIQWNFYDLIAGLTSAGLTGFEFEVATTGGGWGDPAIDLLGGEQVQPGWGGGSESIDRHYYAIPAPSALALLALAGLARRRRS
jgi:hypothetical protein